MDEQTRAYFKDQHNVHLVQYQLGWCTKRKQPFFAGKASEVLRTSIEKICKDKDWELLSLDITDCSVLMKVVVWPADAPAFVANYIKNNTVGPIRDSDKESFEKVHSIWTRNLFVSTGEELDRETFDSFVRSQSRRS